MSEMIKKLFLIAGLFGGLVVASIAAQQPNVVIFLADDLGYGDLSSYGADLFETPNIDRLAAQGVRFTDAHSPAAVCQPGRYALMTGRYNWRRGKPWDGTYMFDDRHPTLQQVLGKAGYDTAAFGKWHNGWGHGPVDYNDAEVKPGPLESGFGYFFGTPRSHNEPPQVFMENRTMYQRAPSDPLRMISHKEVVERGLKDWGWGLSEGAEAAHEARPEDEIDLIVAERAADYLRARSKDEPFFLYVSPVAPHVPISPSERFQGSSDAGDYGDFLQQMDASVGIVLDALERQGLAENTLVIFSSDNGGLYMPSAIDAGHRPNGQLLGQKTDAWNGGNQVPFIVRWPGKVPAGETSDAFVSLNDIMATVTAAVGIDTPDAAIDSVNQLPVFLRPDGESVRKEMVLTGIFGQGLYADGWVFYPFQGSGGMTAHPTQRWGQPFSRMNTPNSDLHPDGSLKDNAPPAQLYNLRRDPGQTTNLYREHPEKVETMKQRLEELLAPPEPPAGDGSTVSISPAAPVKSPVSWNGEVWGDPANVPASGNHYIHNSRDVWLLALGKNGEFPSESLTLKKGASVWLSDGGALGNGVLILDGGQVQSRLDRTAAVLGRIRVDSQSSLLNVSGSLELNAGLSGSGDLRMAAFQQSGGISVGGVDRGYNGSFILADSAKDGVILEVEFSEAFSNAGLAFQSNNPDRRPVLMLVGELRFASARLPAQGGGMVRLKPGTYDADALKAVGVSDNSFRDSGGTLTVRE